MTRPRRAKSSKPAVTRARSPSFGSWATLRDLEILRAIVKHGGFSAAARELGISQPAVSQSVAQIELLSGRKMFDRVDGEVIATADALAIYEESTPVFLGLERLEKFGWSEDPKDSLTIAVPPTQAHCLLPSLLHDFKQTLPTAKINLEICTTLEMVSMIAEGTADLGIGEVPAGDWNVRRQSFRRSVMAVAMPQTHRLASRREVTAEDLEGEPLILLVRRNPIRRQIDRLLKSNGTPVDVQIECSNTLFAVQLVGQEVGLSIVNPFPVMQRSEPGVVFRPFSPALEQDTCFILPDSRPPKKVVKLFVDFVRSHQPADWKLSRAL